MVDEHEKALKPAVLQDYNRHMRYVDKSDHMMNCYSIRRWSWKPMHSDTFGTTVCHHRTPCHSCLLSSWMQSAWQTCKFHVNEGSKPAIKYSVSTVWTKYKNNAPVHWYEDPQQGTHYMSLSSAHVRCVQQIQLCWMSPQDGSLFHWHICCMTMGAVPMVTTALHSAGCGCRRYPEKFMKT